MKIKFKIQADQTLAKETGFHDIIHKPFTPEAIETALCKSL
jgi:hypothetical protein